MGVPWSDAGTVGSLLGIRAVTNEILAYEELGKLARGLRSSSLLSRSDSKNLAAISEGDGLPDAVG